MIQVEHISKAFDGAAVLKDISFEVREAETLAIIGRSGSGKSVLLKHLIGLVKPDEGRVCVDDTDVNQLSYKDLQKLRRRFGVLFQGGALFDSMNTFENVAFPLRRFSSMNEQEIRQQVKRCLEVVQLPDVDAKRTSDLSGGMKKRVALARAIALEPQYILYDEPTSGLDPETSNKIDQLISRLADRLNITGIVVTHDMHSVLSVADRALFLHEGRIHWTGTIDDLHETDDKILRTFVEANEYHIGQHVAARPGS